MTATNLAAEVVQVNDALRVAEVSLQTIDNLLNISIWVLSAFAMLLAIIAVFGWLTIRSASVSAAKDLAENRLDVYIESEEFKQLMEDKILEAVERRWQDTVFISQLDTPKREQDVSAFPTKPGGDDDNG